LFPRRLRLGAQVYPPQLFERRKKYDLPVRMSKHPELNSYIAEIVRGAHAALKQGDLHKLVVAIVEEEVRACLCARAFCALTWLPRARAR
jgi:mitotic spindle assembly checkpoint protein MAD2B